MKKNSTKNIRDFFIMVDLTLFALLEYFCVIGHERFSKSSQVASIGKNKFFSTAD